MSMQPEEPFFVALDEALWYIADIKFDISDTASMRIQRKQHIH